MEYGVQQQQQRFLISSKSSNVEQVETIATTVCAAQF